MTGPAVNEKPYGTEESLQMMTSVRKTVTLAVPNNTTLLNAAWRTAQVMGEVSSIKNMTDTAAYIAYRCVDDTADVREWFAAGQEKLLRPILIRGSGSANSTTVTSVGLCQS